MPFRPHNDGPDRRLRQAWHEAREELSHRCLVEGLQVQRQEGALAGAPSGPPVEELRAGQGDDQDRDVAAPLEEVLDEVQRPGICPVEVLEQERDHAGGRKALEERAPGQEQLRRATWWRLTRTEQREEGRLDPAPLGLVGHVLGEHLADPGAGRGCVVALEEPGARPDHLAQRPERDPLAVRR